MLHTISYYNALLSHMYVCMQKHIRIRMLYITPSYTSVCITPSYTSVCKSTFTHKPTHTQTCSINSCSHAREFAQNIQANTTWLHKLHSGRQHTSGVAHVLRIPHTYENRKFTRVFTPRRARLSSRNWSCRSWLASKPLRRLHASSTRCMTTSRIRILN